jgi:hypothetical protein
MRRRSTKDAKCLFLKRSAIHVRSTKHQDDVGVAWDRLRRSTAQSARLAETYTLSKVARQIIQANK